MTVADATPDLEHIDQSDRAFLGTPRASAISASPKGASASLLLHADLARALHGQLPARAGKMEQVIGLDWLNAHVYPGLSGQPLASAIFGTYTALVYLTPILGGFLADKFFGRNTTLIAGGVLMAIGHFLMAIGPPSCSHCLRSCSGSARSRAYRDPGWRALRAE